MRCHYFVYKQLLAICTCLSELKSFMMHLQENNKLQGGKRISASQRLVVEYFRIKAHAILFYYLFYFIFYYSGSACA